ncbi:hypothetical protein NQ315_005237 [Exocentrus adspersus]|uniref:Centrobin n=1 Tax=Exocentrus adspersus TaxID=1586481 RepID=A0AAV8W111_9CUCU|nr:hypothetical protein NQ315_005237 [Exocentrus adspersus]
MSDTDDTDDLLLIPPDFFIVDSDSGHSNTVPYYNIVDNLIQKVGNLQERIQSIENSSLNTSLDYSFDHSRSMQKPSGFRKYNSSDDLYMSQSTQSTPQKPHTKFKLNSLPSSPYVDKFSPSKPTRTARDFKTSSPKDTRRLSPDATPVRDGQVLNEIDTFLSKVKTIQRINAARNLEREFGDGGIPRGEKHEEPVVTKEATWRQGDNKESVPDYGMGMRDNLYKDRAKANNPGDIYKKQTNSLTNDSWTSIDRYPSSDSSSESTQITAYNNYKKERSDLISPQLHTHALNSINMHKKLLEGETQKLDSRNKVKDPKPRGTNTLSDNLGLLSLADIWSKNSHLVHSNPSQLLQKLQEEKFRRQHCEELIQELQNRNLELQQKLTVAVRVDDSKNKTIQQFQEALEKVIHRLEKVNKEKQDWEQEVLVLKNKHVAEMEEASQNKNVLNNARAEVAQSKKAVDVCQTEFTLIKDECNKLKNELKEERDRMSKLKDEKHFLLSEVEDHKKRQEELKEELAKAKKQLDSNKLELRNYYQGQVEILVQNKLKEFQSQLDQAEKTFKEEVTKREMTVAKTAATHIQQVSEKYSLEIKLLEKKHQEEIKLYQIQIMQYKQQVEGLQSKMDQLHEKRVYVAKQLQKIMESQWAEALRIITNGKSPTFHEDTFGTIDQLNSLKTKSYNNVEEVLNDEQFNGERKQKGVSQILARDSEDMSSISNNFEKNSQQVPNIETPVSSRTQNRHGNENEIQQYINLLLNRPPGNPTQESQRKDTESTPDNNVAERATWQHVEREDINKSKSFQREKRFPKPPWK